MAWDVLKTTGSKMTSSYPKSISCFVISAGGLALFLTFSSWLFVSQPIGSIVSWYFYGVENTRKVDLSIFPVMETNFQFNRDPGDVNTNVPAVQEPSHSSTGTFLNNNRKQNDKDETSESHAKIPLNSNDRTISPENEQAKQKSTVPVTSGIEKQMVPSDHYSGDGVQMVDRNSPLQSQLHDPTGTIKQIPAQSPGLRHEEGVRTNDSSSTLKSNVDLGKPVLKDSLNKSRSVDLASKGTSIHPSNSKTEELPPSSTDMASDKSENDSIASGCDLYHGNWIYDSLGPLYTNNSCPMITQMQNCQGNGRPDKDYENWRWKPSQCDLPRFDPKKFLELMRGKTLAFIGDSVSRNQMESLLCILWQVEVPKNRGNRNMHRYYFRSTSVMIVRIWSSWLVNLTTEAFDFAPAGVDKLHLDVPDKKLMEFIPSFDVIVVSSGHWFTKRSVYVLNNEIVGGQLWWPEKSRPMKVNNIDAFGISVDTFLTALVTHPTYKGLTIVRSYSPDHYEGGAWNTGGSCTGKVKPLVPGELVENGFTNIMHEKQVGGFNSAMKKATNKSKLRLMDITEVFSYRHDGHPGPYRSPDPKKITKRGPNGKPPPQDCLHWCMPGPVDTWNELVFEIKREYEDGKSL